MGDFTAMLESVEQGNSHSADALLNEVYSELRQLAAHRMAGEAPGHTLQPTALVHEAWIRLMGGKDHEFQNKKHFFAAAAQAMRRILIDRSRHKKRKKRAGGHRHIDLSQVTLATEDPDEVVLVVDDAIQHLAAHDPVKAEVVKLRYYIGLNHAEIAKALDLPLITVRRHWTFARSWLYAALTTQNES